MVLHKNFLLWEIVLFLINSFDIQKETINKNIASLGCSRAISREMFASEREPRTEPLSPHFIKANYYLQTHKTLVTNSIISCNSYTLCGKTPRNKSHRKKGRLASICLLQFCLIIHKRREFS